mgnify:CR=1 FL=1
MDDGEGGIDLQGLGVAECKGVKRGVVTDLEETSRAIDAAVRRVEQQIGEKIESLITGVTGTHLEGLDRVKSREKMFSRSLTTAASS